MNFEQYLQNGKPLQTEIPAENLKLIPEHSESNFDQEANDADIDLSVINLKQTKTNEKDMTTKIA
jgi:hypothetical protein